MTGGGNGFSGLSLSGGLQHDPAYDPIYDKAISSASTQVIRLSPDPGPTKAADMTQQQKVAAALAEGRHRNPAAWAALESASPSRSTPIRTSHTPQRNAPEGFDPHPSVVLMKGKNNPTFLISWRSQRDLARSLGWKCALMIWGGPALALLSLYVLLALTHLL